MAKSPESFMFTVGKLDAGMAILLGERAHLIEFPSILLPPGATAGSIVNIAVHRNVTEEKRRDAKFWELQKEIYNTFGVDMPKAPQLELRHVTQTSVTLEWPKLHLATAKLRSLDIYRNGQRLTAIPQPLTNFSTKLSGLEQNTDYTFQLILRTTAGTFPSNIIRVRTHTMTDTSGISVCFGTVEDKAILETAKTALGEIRAKWSDKIQIDTTHFVCTTPASSTAQGGSRVPPGPGVEYQRALQLSLPILQPSWVLACQEQKRMVPIAPYYLGASGTAATTPARHQSMSQASLPRSPTQQNATTAATKQANRASMPPAARKQSTESSSPPAQDTGRVAGAPAASQARPAEKLAQMPEAEEEGEEEDPHERPASSTPPANPSRRRHGTMDKAFKFPPTATGPPPPVPPLPTQNGTSTDGDSSDLAGSNPQLSKHISSPTVPAVEVPPPDPVEKERPRADSITSEGDEDLGETEEISLN